MKKRTSKLISVLLCVMMVLGLMPVTALAEQPVEVADSYGAFQIDITTANVTVTAPVKGGTPAKATTTDTQYTIANTMWEPADSPFAGNTVYSVLVTLEANGGYQFTASTVFKINGSKATIVTRSTEEAKILFTFPATVTNITTANVTVTAPVKDGTPAKATTADTQYNIANTMWEPADSPFAGKTVYSVLVTLEAKSGYQFTASTVFKINGSKATIVTRSTEEAKILFTFPATFVDVSASEYYAPAVSWAVANNITAGTSSTTFSPNATCTRGQVVSFLWRAAGSPEPKQDKNPFTDVKKSDYYYKAVLWASENGIVYGITSTTFRPNQGCTRGQVAAFLWRTAGKPEPNTANCPFSDVSASEYYYKAVTWAAENNIVYGTSSTKFSPNASCTRAQIVTFLYRFLDK